MSGKGNGPRYNSAMCWEAIKPNKKSRRLDFFGNLKVSKKGCTASFHRAFVLLHGASGKPRIETPAQARRLAQALAEWADLSEMHDKYNQESEPNT